MRGVVGRRRDKTLSVAVASLPEELEDIERWRIDLSSDEISSQRQRSALDRAAAARGDRLAQLRDVLLGQREPQFDETVEEAVLDAGLNATQQAPWTSAFRPATWR